MTASRIRNSKMGNVGFFLAEQGLIDDGRSTGHSSLSFPSCSGRCLFIIIIIIIVKLSNPLD